MDVLQVNERLNAMEGETEAGHALRGLILSIVEGGPLPQWFIDLPRKDVDRKRARTVRFTLSKSFPAVRKLMAELEPLAAHERDLRIKVLIRNACTGQKDEPAGKEAQVQPPAASHPQDAAPVIPIDAPQTFQRSTPDQGVDPETLKQTLKNNLFAFGNS
ncbi:MAG: hypothetical protein PHQ87_15005 [Hydrogenophaga sp.]|nr:hypothetical protein [Hydrogenophaga sp.]